ncbi:hypothetical protein BATDEDRAFT_87836 [Batrachochytrium dendrobatidis JAM81]|uniref:Uncharacterized protein n=1 Tax=Batrachochytrium dendrobatidis (strain JAM81 / FGSC 10211) TaxID=684364 RepID=F4P014_BATDJ|nr:uncharacterized protein BATDEDRAFT_87836 [Batrachochytrium dendrobatidis JAM81]EGF81185.1 hypothetical protein BATDEDRAFT_87836 [Batrachochytrium dendrobatidis JAM81]KAJ8326030.1 hypothetical protein O5D80_005665 [Batrachochytrium dendrobatidis]KAK5670021.1 hypothetical protein QVD99_003510 [Batrachochytrium dendrobatidis]|eukprot:XP_006678113.1 hypothetical protein BATDEDRAFT_87836 [Batrachochytrium dendrobatidis JAM81]
MRIIRAAVAPTIRPSLYKVTWKIYALVGVLSVFVGNYSFSPYIAPYFGHEAPTSHNTILKMQQYLMGDVDSTLSASTPNKEQKSEPTQNST